jgi:hypothetical protein
VKIPRDSISKKDAEKIHDFATRITFKMADCGPIQVCFRDGIKMEHTRISGFQPKKARDIIEEMIRDFILKGY